MISSRKIVEEQVIDVVVVVEETPSNVEEEITNVEIVVGVLGKTTIIATAVVVVTPAEVEVEIHLVNVIIIVEIGMLETMVLIEAK